MSEFTPCERCGASLPVGSGPCEDCDREFHEKVALLERMSTEATNARANEILENIDTTPAVELKDGEVVLLGFEGQVDAVIPMKEPRPWVWLHPIPLSLRQMMRYDPTPSTKPEPMRVAEYRRIGIDTYQRES